MMNPELASENNLMSTSGDVALGDLLFASLFDQQVENGDLQALMNAGEMTSSENPLLMSGENSELNLNNNPEIELLGKTPNQDLLAGVKNKAAEATSSEQVDTMFPELTNILNGKSIEASKAVPEEVILADGKKINLAEIKNLKNGDSADVVAQENGELIQLQNLKKSAKNINANINPYMQLSGNGKNKVQEIKNLKTQMIDGISTSESEAQSLKKIDLLSDVSRIHQALDANKSDESNTKEIAKANKVFDLSSLKSSSANEVIDQISNYIIQSAASRKPKVELSVQHEDLGRINVQVTRTNPHQVNIEIMTQSGEAKQFLNLHQADLLSHLSNSGINVSDLKIDQSNTSNQTDSNSKNSGEGFGGKNQFSQNHSEDNNKREDSKRREEMWNLYKRNVA